MQLLPRIYRLSLECRGWARDVGWMSRDSKLEARRLNTLLPNEIATAVAVTIIVQEDQTPNDAVQLNGWFRKTAKIMKRRGSRRGEAVTKDNQVKRHSLKSGLDFTFTGGRKERQQDFEQRLLSTAPSCQDSNLCAE